MNIIDFTLRVNGYPINKAKQFIKPVYKLSGEKLLSYLDERKRTIVSYHIKNNKFYNDKVQEYKRWDDLPVLTKKDLQVKLDKRLSDEFLSQKVYLNKTSGSTGDPFYFAKDKFCHALTWANIQNQFDNHGLYGKKQARFYGLPKSKLARYKERIKDFFSNRYRFDVFDLSNTAFELWIKRFSNNRFVYINGYTTVLVLFAKYLIQKNIVLSKLCPSLKACVVTSEMCSDSDKIILEKGLGVNVINEYGASELDLIAFQNKDFEWQVNTATLYVEILDEDNNQLPFGNEGRVVITSLYNKAHPFIRYDIGDIGVLEKKKGKIILKELIGRKEDYVKLPSGKVAPGLTFYYVTKSLMEKSQNVKEIKVSQKKIDTFEIRYVSQVKLTPKEENQVKQALEEYLEPNLNIRLIRCSSLERSKSGKLKQFHSEI